MPPTPNQEADYAVNMTDNKSGETIAVDMGGPKDIPPSQRNDSMYNRFDGVYPHIATDPKTCKATEIKLLSFARPHMRGFHVSWISFFLAFFCWFSITPLLSTIKEPPPVGLGLSKEQIWTSSIVAVCGTIVMRLILGPMCDKYGPRLTMAIVLVAGAIPTGLTGLINSATDLILIHLFIGVIGSCFVMCQYWTTTMFNREVAGTANAIVGGWGNLGGGVTQLVMGSVLFPIFKTGMSTENAWRSVCAVPAFVVLCWAGTMIFISDDSPKGNYDKLQRTGAMKKVSAKSSFGLAAKNLNTWLLFCQYGCSFGVELTMNNAAALYFRDDLGQTVEGAAAIASIFGFMNLFARGLGGFLSDKMNSKFSMRGRLWVQVILMALEGAMIIVFSRMESLATAIITMTIFSVFVQACEGSTYGIVPYVDPPNSGSISGIVGAGGNVGAVAFGFVFRQMAESKDAFEIMGAVVMGCSLLPFFIVIPDYKGLIWGTEVKNEEQINVDMYANEPGVDKEAVAHLGHFETGPNANDRNPWIAAAAEPRSDMRSRRSQDAFVPRKIHLTHHPPKENPKD